ncbi:heat shock protein 15 [Rubritalea halochordaticola]|uniref:Heat shock protein 15 n=1 Tax=Rubritalea halochordaticola TaxID=714537 RepID=A0ABP9V6T0_9BACT
MEPTPSIRIDKWLWAVRLYKTRSQAAQACNAGKVKRANKSIKASTPVKVGDHLDVPSHDGTHKRHVEVLEIHEKRVGAPIAREAYTDHTPKETLERAKEVRAEKRLSRIQRKEGDQGRMTKKQRRDWKKGLFSHKRDQDAL